MLLPIPEQHPKKQAKKKPNQLTVSDSKNPISEKYPASPNQNPTPNKKKKSMYDPNYMYTQV